MEYAINICSIILSCEHLIRKKLFIQHGDLEAVLFIVILLLIVDKLQKVKALIVFLI